MRPEFVAVDGEAVKDGRYVLMRSNLGHELINPRGITTRQAFEFLLQLKAPHRVIVCFGLNYDVNQWIRDLPRGELQELWETQQTGHAWRYKLRWWPRKYLYVRDITSQRSIEVAEVLGYFQMPFVDALEAWGIGAPAEIARMKEQRAQFTLKDLPAMRRYCLRECELLVDLMDALAQSVYDAGLAPRAPGSARSWIGAGSIASTLLAQNGVDAHHAYDAEIATRHATETAILGAMFGGRIEMLRAGIIDRAQTRDIRSAYPHAITSLPSLDGARLKHRRGRSYTPGREAIWRVSWDATGCQLAPFPARKPDGTIWYVERGSGCYHAVEVDAAVKLGYDVQIKEGWELLVGHNPAPCFGFIEPTYRLRARLKEQGQAAEKALKLGLNSCYGKLAQGFGASGSAPRFQSYYWAGRITATTRARMLLAAHNCRDPVMISTDGLFALAGGPKAARVPRLGTWEGGTVQSLFSVQPGVYHAYRGDGEVRRSRGFRSSELDWEELRAGYEAHGLDHVQVFSSRRFIGIGVAFARRDPACWRTWPDSGRSLCIYPDRKRVGAATGRGGIALWPFSGPIDSEPYTPKQDLYDDPTPAKLENMIADDQPGGSE